MSLDELPLSTSAYLADTQQLSLPQHGAYLLILMTMWRAGGWIVDNDRKLANICKVTLKKWLQIAPDIRSLLIARDGKLTQKRLLSETQKALNRVAQNKSNGSAGGKAKALKSKEPTLANATSSLRVRHKPPPTGDESALTRESTLKDSKTQKVKKVRAESKSKGEVVPDDWKPKPTHYEAGLNLGYSRDVINGFAEKMRRWSIANANRAVARKSNWDAAFHNWLADRAERNFKGASNATAGNDSQGNLGFAGIAATLRAARNDR